jgi:alpha-beta hydrolase superfamily lysophospholipase
MLAPDTMPDLDALTRAGADRPTATVLAVCPNKRALTRATRLKQQLADAIGPDAMPTWIELVRADVPGAHAPSPNRVVYARRLRSKLKAQLRLLSRKPDALLVFDNACDLPIWRGALTIHLDRDRRQLARLEPDPLLARFTHVARCLGAILPAAVHALTVRPDRSGLPKA